MWKMHLRQRERCCLLMEILTMTVHPLTNFSECPFGSTYSKLLSARPLDTDTLLGLMTECSENARRSGHPHRPHTVCTCTYTHTIRMCMHALAAASPPVTVTSQRSEVEGDMFNSSHAVARISLAVLCSCAEKWQLLPSFVWTTRGTGETEEKHSWITNALCSGKAFLCNCIAR